VFHNLIILKSLNKLKSCQFSNEAMRTLSCREAGYDCDYIVEGNTEDEILSKGKEHAMAEHGMKESDFTPEIQDKLKSMIHNN